MPISARDKRRMEAHKNAELSHTISQYDTIFSSTPNMTLAQMLRIKLDASIAVLFVLFLVLYLLLFLVLSNGLLNFATVAWASLLSLAAGYISDAYLNRNTTAYSAIKALAVSVINAFLVFLILALIYVEYRLLQTAPQQTVYLLIIAVLAAAVFYFTMKYNLSTTARFRATRQQQLNSFDVSWRLLDNSYWGFLAFKLLFNISMLAIAIAAIAYNVLAVSVALAVVLALLTAVYQLARKGIFETLAAKTGYYNPQV